MKHKNLTGASIHVPHTWTYADATARTAASGFASDDVGKFARQSDNNTVWMLTGYSPAAWTPVSPVSGLVLLGSSTSAGSAAYLEVGSIPGTYRNLIIDFVARSQKAAANEDAISLSINSDTTDANYRHQTWYNLTEHADKDNRFMGTIPAANGLANNFGHYRLTILGYAGTWEHAIDYWGLERRTATEHYRWWGNFWWENTAAITTIRIGTASNNLVSGSAMRVWGEL